MNPHLARVFFNQMLFKTIQRNCLRIHTLLQGSRFNAGQARFNRTSFESMPCYRILDVKQTKPDSTKRALNRSPATTPSIKNRPGQTQQNELRIDTLLHDLRFNTDQARAGGAHRNSDPHTGSTLKTDEADQASIREIWARGEVPPCKGGIC